jgi:hypothetical protein
MPGIPMRADKGNTITLLWVAWFITYPVGWLVLCFRVPKSWMEEVFQRKRDREREALRTSEDGICEKEGSFVLSPHSSIDPNAPVATGGDKEDMLDRSTKWYSRRVSRGIQLRSDVNVTVRKI